MLPELFHIGPIPIRAFGLTMALSFLLGVWYVRKMGARDKKPFEEYLSVAYLLIFGGIIGARLGYVVLHWSDFADNIGSIFNPFQSDTFGIAGLNLYGGVLLAILAATIYLRVKKLPVLDVFDYFAPTLALGIGITRLGCYANGCCFGTPTDLPWGVVFPEGSLPDHVFHGAHIHPAQLYSSLYGLGLFAALHFVLKKRAFVGQVTAILFMVEAVFRFAIEYVRYYEDAMVFQIAGITITWNQVVSVGLFVAGLVMYLTLKKSSEKAPVVEQQ